MFAGKCYIIRNLRADLLFFIGVDALYIKYFLIKGVSMFTLTSPRPRAMCTSNVRRLQSRTSQWLRCMADGLPVWGELLICKNFLI